MYKYIHIKQLFIHRKNENPTHTLTHSEESCSRVSYAYIVPQILDEVVYNEWEKNMK